MHWCTSNDVVMVLIFVSSVCMTQRKGEDIGAKATIDKSKLEVKEMNKNTHHITHNCITNYSVGQKPPHQIIIQSMIASSQAFIWLHSSYTLDFFNPHYYYIKNWNTPQHLSNAKNAILVRSTDQRFKIAWRGKTLKFSDFQASAAYEPQWHPSRSCSSHGNQPPCPL